MRVLSLFDGMSCGQIALKKLGVVPNEYFACEVDKYAIKVSSENFPSMKHLGDVTLTDFKSLGSIDLLMGGSPCQGFSFAGKQLNFNDPRSKLFFEFVRALKEAKPKWFLLENVIMKQEYQDIISKHVGVRPIRIESSLLSAQKRSRLYWTNIPVSQPEDKGILLKDILENGFTEKDKAFCLDANYFKGASVDQYPTKNRRQLVFLGGLPEGIRLKDGKFLSRNFREGYRVYSTEGKAATLTAQSKGGLGGYSGLYGEVDSTKIKFRKLTVLECKRLQTVPDDYVMNVSNSQAYKMLGNGWTVDVIAHILKGSL